MRAFILAGGFGTRLRAVVNDRPKPLAPVGDAPFLEHQIEFLKAHGTANFVLCVGYRNEQIREHFGDGEKWGVAIEYSIESEPLGTAGALKLAYCSKVAGTLRVPSAKAQAAGTRSAAKDAAITGGASGDAGPTSAPADEPFLVVNGDTYFDLNLAMLIQAHLEHKRNDACCAGTIALTEIADPRSYGSVTLDSANAIVGFHEKPEAVGHRPSAEVSPSWSMDFNPREGGAISDSSRVDSIPCCGVERSFISAGVYVLEPRVLDLVPLLQNVSLEREVFPAVLERGGKLYGHRADGFFVDIGTPEGYRRFQEHVGASAP